MTSSAFDKIAAEYDTIWTHSVIGRCQRDAVWRFLDPLIQPGHSILDLGCGTGEDAFHLMNAGAEVCGIDASSEMVSIARRRGIDARQLPLEALSALRGAFDGAISNFGVLNCVQELKPVSMALSRLIRPGGFLALCLMGSFCAWETCYWAAHRNFRKAFRRLSRDGTSSSFGVHLRYPSVRRIKKTFQPAFRLTRWVGIGVFVPPSYVDAVPPAVIERFAGMDRAVARWPVLRSLADHRLFLFNHI